MPTDDDQMIEDMLRAFRKKRVEPEWDKLDAPDASRYQALWAELQDLGLTSFGLPEAAGGIALDAVGRCDILSEIGGASPALALGLVSHVTAVSLLVEASSGRLPESLARAALDARFALAGSPLDRDPSTAFRFAANGTITLSGSQRVGLAFPDWIVVPAHDGARLHLCALRVADGGVHFAGRRSSHGLRLIPFGELSLDHRAVRSEHVFAWPTSGRAANEADGLVTALLSGMASELGERAMRYALDRRQGGKMIHEHDAVQELTGPIELARRILRTLALEALSRDRPGDGGASAFAVELVRKAGLDAVQTLGGYGYMEDYRVERYLRDANTLETSVVHASARRRQIARARFAELAS